MFPQLSVALTLLFFVSGAVALVYEVIWQRLLTLNFGISAFATATILAAFMGGLALGSLVAERYAPGLKAPARVYALLEAGVGLYALILPTLLKGVLALYGPLYGALSLHPILDGLVLALLSFLLLLPPTAMMGATFPILVEAVSAGSERRGDRLGWLYGVNCGGAFLGCLLTAFVLLPAFGLRGSTWLAAALSFGVAGLAWALGRWAQEGARFLAELGEGEPALEAPAEAKAPDPDAYGGLGALSVGAALTGAAAMVYELAFFRLLTLQVGSSIYAFSLMLSAFLLGLTLGSLLAGVYLGRRPQGGRWAFGAAQLGACLAVVVVAGGIPHLPAAYVQIFGALGTGSVGGLAVLAFSGVVLVPAAMGLGASLPLAAAAVDPAEGGLTRGAARIYGANTLGAVAGTLAGGFGLLPTVGIQGALLVGVALNAGAVLAVGWPGAEWRRRLDLALACAVVLGVGILTRPPWEPLLMSAGVYQDLGDLVGRSREEINRWARSGSELLYYAEGLNTAVTVGKGEDSGNIWLANNGKVDASSDGDLDTQLMLAHLPMGFHPEAERVGVIGLASGITLGAVTQYPVERVDILELEPAIVAASHYFDDYNGRPLEDPRVHLHLMDARRYLRWEEAGFDVLISEPSNPWISGVSNLFTQEFFALAKARLRPGGILCQWIQLYELSPGDLRLLLRTLQSVFPEVLLFGSLDSADLMVLAAAEPLDFEPTTYHGAFEIPPVAKSLRRLRYDRPEDVLSWYLMGSEGVREMVGEGPLNTDDNAWIELRAPLYLSKKTAYNNFDTLVGAHEGPLGRFGDALGPEVAHWLAQAYLKRNLFHFSAMCAERARTLGLQGPWEEDFKIELVERMNAYPYKDASAP